MAESPVLAYPDYSKPFVLYTDASDVGIGSVLLQKQEEKFRTIRYLSKTLTPAERNYSSRERECLAIVHSVYLRHTLEMIQRTYWWPNMYKQVSSLVEKCDLCQMYTKQVKLLKEWRENLPPQRSWSTISVDSLHMPASEEGHVEILNIQDDSSTFGVFVPVKRMTAAQTAFHLLYHGIAFGKLKTFSLIKDLVSLEKWRLKTSLREPLLHIFLNPRV